MVADAIKSDDLVIFDKSPFYIENGEMRYKKCYEIMHQKKIPEITKFVDSTGSHPFNIIKSMEF